MNTTESTSSTTPAIRLTLTTIVFAFIGHLKTRHNIDSLAHPVRERTLWERFLYSLVEGNSMLSNKRECDALYGFCPRPDNSVLSGALYPDMDQVAENLMEYGVLSSGCWKLKDPRFVDTWRRELDLEILEFMYEKARTIPGFLGT